MMMQNFSDRFPRLNLPPARLQLHGDPDKPQVYDRLRQKTVALTPEEWVRQHFVNMLISDLGYPAGLMANEVGLKLNGMSRRADTIVYDHAGLPLMIVEYKAPGVNITQEAFNQIVRYHMVLRARYLTVSNGISHFCCRLETTTESGSAPRPVFIKGIPRYDQL